MHDYMYGHKGNDLVKGQNMHDYGGKVEKTYPVAVAHVDNVQVEDSLPQHSVCRVWRRLLG